jgi:predicted HicB family RNase H-like nuclease
MLLSFEMYQDAGEPIPVPVNEDDFKGNIAYRTTTQRHFEIAKEAKKRKISLSQMIDHYIDNGRSSKK